MQSFIFWNYNKENAYLNQIKTNLKINLLRLIRESRCERDTLIVI